MSSTTSFADMPDGQDIWHCSDRGCSTGQTTQLRVKTGRKVASQFFGRNKNATKAIDADVWHWQCRKGYQRAKYAADHGGPAEHLVFFGGHFKHQLRRIKLWRPQATFDVQLSKAAKGRLATYHAALRRPGGSHATALATIAVQPKVGRNEKKLALSLADAVTSVHAEHINAHFSGVKSLDFVLCTIVPWIEVEFGNGSMLQMPPVEFLLQDPVEDEVINDPFTNFQQWCDHQDGKAPVMPDHSGTKRQRHDGDDFSNGAAKRLTIRINPKAAAAAVRRRANSCPNNFTQRDHDTAIMLLQLGQVKPFDPPRQANNMRSVVLRGTLE